MITAFFTGGRGTGHADRSCFAARVNGDEDHAQTVDFGSGAPRGRADGGYRVEPGRRASPARPGYDGGHPVRRLGRRGGRLPGVVRRRARSSWSPSRSPRSAPSRCSSSWPGRAAGGRRSAAAAGRGPAPATGGPCRRSTRRTPAAPKGRRSPITTATGRCGDTDHHTVTPGTTVLVTAPSTVPVTLLARGRHGAPGRTRRANGSHKEAPGAAARPGGLPKRHPACLRYLYR